MTPLRQAIDDYIALRRSLGFKLRRMSEGLRESGVFLEQRAAPYVTTALAMEWAMLPTHHQPSDSVLPAYSQPDVDLGEGILTIRQTKFGKTRLVPLHTSTRDVMADYCRCRPTSARPSHSRHSTAMHLLQSGVDITVIALWLGHESLETTHGYVQADLRMKEQALGKLAPVGGNLSRFKPDDALLAFLSAL